MCFVPEFEFEALLETKDHDLEMDTNFQLCFCDTVLIVDLDFFICEMRGDPNF